MIAPPLLLAFALAGVVVALVLLDRMFRDVGFMAGAVLVVTAVVAFAGEPPTVVLGGFALTLNDVLMAFAGSAVVARLLRGVTFPRMARLLVGILVLVGWSLFRGIGDYGVAAAVNEARGALDVYLVALYFATAPTTERMRNRLGDAWMYYATFLVVLAVGRWLAVFGPLPTSDTWYIPGEYGGLRVLWSDEAFVLGMAFVIMLPGLLRGALSRVQRVMAFSFLATVLLTQHRSVWAATLVGIALVLVLEGNLGRRWARRLVLATGVTAMLLLTLLSGPLLEQSVTRSDAASSDTFEWRMEGWVALYRDSGPASPAEVLVGRPYGAGWFRRLSSLGYTTDVVPHNYYIEQNLRVGVLGVALLLAFYVGVMRRLSWSQAHVPQSGLLSDRTLVVLLGMQLLYYIPYWPAPEQALLFGFAAAASRTAAIRAREHASAQQTERTDRDGAVATLPGHHAGPVASPRR